MNTSENHTIRDLFANTSIRFEIPQYQRAYSWGKEQWAQFFRDLCEAENGYYLGHYLFEKEGDRRLVIDGQQRLTTCVVFVRAVLDSIGASSELEKKMRIWARRYLNDPDLGQRMETVPYDRTVFRDCIVKGHSAPASLQTHSARNLVEAKRYFTEALRGLKSDEMVEQLLARLEESVITTYEVADRAMAARMFAFQNDRGKKLTKLEVIKSYLMLTVYLKGGSDRNQEESAAVIDDRMGVIYETITRADLDEDQVLGYFWKARNGYWADDEVSGVKRQIEVSESPMDWLDDFICELTSAFVFAEKFKSSDNDFVQRLRLLNNPAMSMPFLLKAFLCGIKMESKTFRRLTRLMENLTFRSLIRGGRADIQSRLDFHLKQFNDESTLLLEIGKMVDSVKKDLGWWFYWGDAELKRCLEGPFYGNRVDNYLLWQYELSLYTRGYKVPVAVTTQEMMKNESIEHIAPQTEAGDGDLSAGYGVYDDKEHEENGIVSGGWMNCLGNLLLASQSQNSALGNKPFSEKLADYGKCLLVQQQKVSEYAVKNSDGSSVWSVESIRRRQDDIVTWAMKYWSVDNV